MGFFNGGRFNLTISLRYTPGTGEVGFVCDLVNRASAVLNDATDGAHSIGTVLISVNGMGGADADIWIHPQSDVWPNSTSARLWFPTEAMDMSQDYLMWPTILAHELSHYLYDLRDEYNNGSVCQGDITTQASIMEGYDWSNYTRWTDASGSDYTTFATFFGDYTGGSATLQLGEPSEFCHAGNHNATANNNQNNLNGGQSCWTYIANDANHNGIAYGLTAPGAAGPALAAPAAPPAVVCTTLIPVQRFMLVLDRSGSMAGAKLDQLKIGANFWVDYVNPLEELGAVTYASTASTDMARSEVPAAGAAQTTWRDSRHATIDGLSAGGATAIGDALRRGLNEIVAGGRASSQVILLFTDGLQNAGSETAEHVLPDLRANGVRVYTVGLGGDQDAALLQSIATTTGASYFPISGDLPPAQAEAAISQSLIQIAGQSRENGGVVAFNDVDSAGDSINDDAPFFDRPGPKTRRSGGRSIRFPVRISEGSTHATLGAMWQTPKGRRRVRIYSPSGTLVTAGPRVRAVRGKYPYAFFEIDMPEPGTWQVEVIGEGLTGAGLRSIGFEVNPSVRLEATATPHHARPGQEVQLRARLLTPHPVPGARIVARVNSPAGDWRTVRLREGKEGTAEEGLYTATIPTDEQYAGQYLIVLDAFRKAGAFRMKLEELYMLHPGFRSGEEVRKIATPEIRRQAILSVVTSKEGPGKEAILGANDVDPVVPRDQEKQLRAWQRKHPQKKRPPRPDS